MKKILISLCLCIFSVGFSYAEYGYVTLNNGSVIEGQIRETETEVKITTSNGKEYCYPKIEVLKISDEATPTPTVGKNPSLVDYMDFDRGFWIRANFNASMSIFVSHKCTPLFDVTVAGGYRFNQFLKVGIGLGARVYVMNDDIRTRTSMWAMPLFATIEGNIINDDNRTVTPYYSFDIGGTMPDGFMMRPTVGLRIGQSRSAFLVGLTYTGQVLKYKYSMTNRFISCLGVSLGYEY